MDFPRVVIDSAKSHTLKDFLVAKFKNWCPQEPEVINRTKHSITLKWALGEPFAFIEDQLLYRIEKNNKMPPWIVVYRGGKTVKEIDNLAPRHPHKFRLKVILKATAVHTLADRALNFYGDEKTVYEKMAIIDKNLSEDSETEGSENKGDENSIDENKEDVIVIENQESKEDESLDESGDAKFKTLKSRPSFNRVEDHPWLESQWSSETWTSTDTDGTSIVCFCMAVRCGYIKQVQSMLDERPDLINTVNPTNGFTPLATAVRRGDINTVRLLLSAGADVNQHSYTGQTALHLAVLSANTIIAELLLEKGADMEARDLNGLRVEHYGVESCDLATLKYVLDKGGDLAVEDNNGWTPLFRALCQGAKTEIITELVSRGSDVDAKDRAGLPLASVARLLKNRHGRHRDSVLRLVDSSYPHEKALANFTRLTKKIYNVHSLLKLPGLSSKANLRD